MPDVILVVGTGTGIGKTWTAAALVRALRARGREVAARKPVQSYDPADESPTDSDVLAQASGEPPHHVCPPHLAYPVPLAPPMAAQAFGSAPPRMRDLIAALHPIAQPLAVVEGVGGPRSPVAADGDNVDLARALGPALVVLVAPSGLGAINDVMLCRDVLRPWPQVVFMNRFDDRDQTHRLNLTWLRERGIEVYPRLDAIADAIATATSASLAAGGPRR